MSTRSNGVPVAKGAWVGSGAFGVGLATTFIIGQIGLNRTLGFIVALAPVEGTIFAFSTLHLWPQVLGARSMGGYLILTIVPLVILVASGYHLASGSDRGNGFVDGASVAVGYLGLTLVAFGYLIFLASGRTGMALDLEVVIAIIFTGILYPALFGGIGGLIADST